MAPGRHVTDSSNVTKRNSRTKAEPIEPIARFVGRRVRQLRDAAGITQDELGRRAKLTPKFISQVENGRANPSIGVVAQLAVDGLGVPLSAFFSDSPPDEAVEEIAAVSALVGAQSPAARRRALRVLRALFDE